jgi:hypothetical protein
MGTGYFFGGRGGQGVGLIPHPHLVCRGPRKSRAIPLLTLRAFVVCKKISCLHPPKLAGTHALKLKSPPGHKTEISHNCTVILCLLHVKSTQTREFVRIFLTMFRMKFPFDEKIFPGKSMREMKKYYLESKSRGMSYMK